MSDAEVAREVLGVYKDLQVANPHLGQSSHRT
jgi:hypothetical protein